MHVAFFRDGAQTNTNENMVNIMAHRWKETRLAYDIRMVWVRGHSDNVGNELADRIAAHGANEEINAERWSWRPRDWGYWELRRDCPPTSPTSFAISPSTIAATRLA